MLLLYNGAPQHFDSQTCKYLVETLVNNS